MTYTLSPLTTIIRLGRILWISIAKLFWKKRRKKLPESLSDLFVKRRHNNTFYILHNTTLSDVIQMSYTCKGVHTWKLSHLSRSTCLKALKNNTYSTIIWLFLAHILHIHIALLIMPHCNPHNYESIICFKTLGQNIAKGPAIFNSGYPGGANLGGVRKFFDDFR